MSQCSLFALLLWAVLLLGACSNSDDDPVLVVPASTAAPSPTSAPVVAPATTTVQRVALFDSAAPIATDDCPGGLLDNNSSVSTVGLDEVRFGMTISQAEEAARVCLVAEGEAVRACHYVRPVGGPDGVGFMVTEGTIERVDIIAEGLTTRSGAGIGTTEQQILELFGAKIETRPNPLGVGNWLLFIPTDTDDQQFRVIWEVDEAGETSAFRAGRLPQVEWANGCP